ncbi:MAG TPA: CHAT domain-containing tetratricopeptide repeat protein [Blastocatellia bacterium]|nr:CHAT domain-containing tetratricopeptide repeat protein [Blastocatellia bacterium]
MSMGTRLGQRLLALILSFSIVLTSLDQRAYSTPTAQNSSDQEALRALTEKYGATIAASDLEGMRQLWDPQSPDLDARLRFYQRVFTNVRVEFVSLNVTRLEVTGDKAVSRLTTDERHLDKRTGVPWAARNVFHGACRALGWVKTDAGWKIEREYRVQDALAAGLEAAVSEQERDELLAKEQALVTDALSGALITRGHQSQMRGDYEKALRCFRLAQAVSEKIGDLEGLAGALNNIGTVKTAQFDYEQALLAQQKALAIFEALGLKRGSALVLEHLSGLYRSLGEYRESFDCAQRSLRLYEEVKHPRGAASALTELASVYGIQNNPQQALAHQERAKKIFEELEDKIQIAILRDDMAREHLALGNYDRALELLNVVLRETESHGDRAGAALVRNHIGKVYAAQGRYEEALDYHRQALVILGADAEKRSLALALANMTNAYLAVRKFSEALPIAERAVSLARQVGQPLDIWSALTAAGHCQLALQRPAEARQSFTEAVAIIERLRGQAVGSAEDSQRYFEEGLRAHHGLLSLLVKENQPQEALVFAERVKARTLLDALQQGRVSVQKAMTAEERERERRLKLGLTMLNTQLTRITQSGKPDPQRIGDLTPRLEKARLDYEAFQTSLYAAHPELKTHRGDAPVIKVDELPTLIHAPDSALLEYVVTDDATYLFTVTKADDKREAGTKVFTLPIKRAELARQVEDFRRRMAGRDLGFRDAARRLYDLLLKPAQAQLRGKTDLVIAPDDKLWELPFQALLADNNRYVLEKSAVSYAPSLTVLREMAKARGRGAENSRASLLAFGNPALGEETVARAALAMRDEKLDPLPEAEAEVKGLAHLYGAAHSKIYLGAEAREDRAKNEAGEFRVLHFATHGVLNDAAPMYSHLVLAQADRNEDGLLEAWELMQMDLRADLVVLSACETARGRFGAGEGVIGLSWAMFVAGAPATVVSQWKVESASTRELMLGFHQRLIASSKEKMTKAEALRQAALKLMKNPGASHPFYWAGFVLVGDGR